MLLRGEKTKRVKEAFHKLGFQATRSQVSAWLGQKYGKENGDVAESTYYNIRKIMNEFARLGPSNVPSGRKVICGVLDAVDGAGRMQLFLDTEKKEAENGIAYLVSQLKLVVSKLGKNETKELVDVL